MANFSVEWLSQSYYGAAQSDAEEMTPDSNSDLVGFTEESRIQQQYSPSSPNNSCGYTSGSESEVGDDSEGEANRRPQQQQHDQQQQQHDHEQQQQQHRRIRTKFTSEQISKLENTFNKHKYLGATQRRKLSEKLSLSETQVKTWFQNRRMKMKREVQDLRPDFLPVPAALLPPALFQHRGLSGQLLPGGFYSQLQPLHQHRHRATGLSPPPRPGILHPHFY